MSTEIEEDFECSSSLSIEELEAQRLMSIEVAGLAEGKHRSQLPASDVHIQRFGANVQEAVRIGELAELTIHFDGRCPIRLDDMHVAKFFERANDFLPARKIKFMSSITIQSPGLF